MYWSLYYVYLHVVVRNQRGRQLGRLDSRHTNHHPWPLPMGGGQSTTRLVERAAAMAPSTSSQEAVAKAISFDGITIALQDVLGTSSQSRVFRLGKGAARGEAGRRHVGRGYLHRIGRCVRRANGSTALCNASAFHVRVARARPVVGAGRMDSAGLAVGLICARAPVGSQRARRLNMVVKKRAAAQIEEMRPKVALRSQPSPPTNLGLPKLLEILRNFCSRSL